MPVVLFIHEKQYPHISEEFVKRFKSGSLVDVSPETCEMQLRVSAAVDCVIIPVNLHREGSRLTGAQLAIRLSNAQSARKPPPIFLIEPADAMQRLDLINTLRQKPNVWITRAGGQANMMWTEIANVLKL